MKICPKCRREVQGNHCPFCDELKIKDKRSEYESRKQEYLNRMSEEGTDKKELDAKDKISKKTKILKFCLPITAAGIAAVIGFYAYLNREKQDPRKYDSNLYYTTTDNGISQVNRIEKGQKVESLPSDKSALSYNKSALFETELPEECKNPKWQLAKVVADPIGRYFAFTAYDSSRKDKNYVLYLYEKGGACKLIKESDSQIEVKVLTNTACVAYLLTDVTTGEWGLGSKSLEIYKGASSLSEEGQVILREKAVDSVDFYEDIKTLIIYSKNDAIKTFRLEDTGGVNTIAKDVSALEVESLQADNLFLEEKDICNTNTGADRIVYLSKGTWHLHNLAESGTFSTIDLGSASDRSATFAYDDYNTVVYRIGKAGVFIADIDDKGKLDTYKKVDSFAVGSKRVWLQAEKTLVYVTAEGELKSLSSSGLSYLIEENVIATSLMPVENDAAFIYKKTNGDIVYMSSSDKSSSKLIANTATFNISKIAKSGDQLYYQVDNILNKVSIQGGQSEEIAKIEDFWLGDN